MSFIQKILFEKSNSTFIQFFRYGIVGGLAFLFDFGILIALTELLKIHYLTSAAISFIIGLCVNYFLSITWVFSKRALENAKHEFLIFSIIGVLGLGINQLGLYILTDFLAFHYTLSKIFTAILVFMWNFITRKLILFQTRKKL